MFKSLKNKFVSVKDNVTTSIKNVGTEIGTKLTSGSSTHDRKDDVQLSSIPSLPQDVQSVDSRECNDAAQDLLHRYEVSWGQLYKSSQNNLLKAKMVAKDLHHVHNAVSCCESKIDELDAEVKQLPDLLASIQQLTDQLVDLHSHCALIEDGLAVLENLCDNSSMAKAKLEEERKLAAYKTHRQKLVADYSAKLAGEHKRKIIAAEMREAELRREKELFYQKAFEEDIRRFKAEQKLVQSQTSLEEMTIEPDTDEAQELEAFLNDGDAVNDATLTTDSAGQHSSSDNQNNGLEDSGEEPHVVTNGITSDGSDVSPLDGILSPRPHGESDSSLEWDYREDDINISDPKQLESSLEKEINGIIQQSQEVPAAVEGELSEDCPSA